jgi:6-phosphogluconolactonase
MLPYLPTTVAEGLAAILDEAAAVRGRATLAIPGGRSPGPVLTELARILTPFVRQRLHLLWLDERAVPRGHADRNDAPTLAAWQAGGPLPAHVHIMPAEAADLDAAADTYAATLAGATGGDPLDLCLIGIGEDGHLASLFPDHAGLSELGTVFAVTDSPKPPPRRLTLGLGPISQARQRLVLALGAAKGDVYRRAQQGPQRGLPISLLPKTGTTWYLDDAAALAIR